MPRPVATQPTDVELQILRILWERGPSPVRDIHAQLGAEKGTSYSTTVKMLSVMLQKGLVKRNENAQPHVYRAVLTRENAGRRMVKSLIEKVFDGSASHLVLQALSSEKATKQSWPRSAGSSDEMEEKTG
jgi:predicted transcriptional regulator